MKPARESAISRRVVPHHQKRQAEGAVVVGRLERDSCVESFSKYRFVGRLQLSEESETSRLAELGVELFDTAVHPVVGVLGAKDEAAP